MHGVFIALYVVETDCTVLRSSFYMSIHRIYIYIYSGRNFFCKNNKLAKVTMINEIRFNKLNSIKLLLEKCSEKNSI